MVIVIGLTGGIATGKSTVSKMLSELGASMLNADEVGHELLKLHSQVWEEVVSTFGKGVLGPSGEVNRQKLGEIVFDNTQMLKRLNQIMHPGMYRVVERKMEKLREQGVDVVVLEAPLLIEARWTSLVDKIWVTTASEATVLKRLQSKNFTPVQALARMRSQLPSAERAKWADVIINTDCELSQLRSVVKELWSELQRERGQ